MNYPIPVNPEEIMALRHYPIDEEIVAAAIAGVIQFARSQGQSLDDLKAEVMQEEAILDHSQRRWLSEILAHAWQSLT